MGLLCKLLGHYWERRPYSPDKPPNDRGRKVCKWCNVIGPEWDNSPNKEDNHGN